MKGAPFKYVVSAEFSLRREFGSRVSPKDTCISGTGKWPVTHPSNPSEVGHP
jgi:hypothetical protein